MNHSKLTLEQIAAFDLNKQYQLFRQFNPQKTHDFNKFKQQPLISVVVPIYNASSQWLNLTIKSVVNQSYPHWQLILQDDGSYAQSTKECLKHWQDKDPRILINYSESNQGVGSALNQAIGCSNGSFIALLEHMDRLDENALWFCVNSLNQKQSTGVLYTDEDEIDASGNHLNPYLKPEFNLDALLSFNYIKNLCVIRKSLGDKVKWFRSGFDGAHTYDLLLRLLSFNPQIERIPQVLYHKMKFSSPSAKLSNKDYQDITIKAALQDYIFHNGLHATVQQGLFDFSFHIKRQVHENQTVSIIIPFKDQFSLLKNCMDSLLAITSHRHYEVLLINNQSSDSDVLEYAKQLTCDFKHVLLFDFDESFNFSRLNNIAAKKASGEFLLFLNNDTKIIHHDWLQEMVSHIQREKVGAVGAKLLYADDTIQHSGMVASSKSVMHLGRNEKDGAVGYFQRANYVQNVSVCTGACLMVKKSLFFEVDGFDEALFPITFNDVDLCLKIRKAGYLIVYTPFAKLYHYESKSRGSDAEPEKLKRYLVEQQRYRHKWADFFENGDPYYHPNFVHVFEVVCFNVNLEEYTLRDTAI